MLPVGSWLCLRASATFTSKMLCLTLPLGLGECHLWGALDDSCFLQQVHGGLTGSPLLGAVSGGAVMQDAAFGWLQRGSRCA